MDRKLKKAYKLVFDDLSKIGLFMGKYDAIHGKETFMLGIGTIMEYIASSAEDDTYKKFDSQFYTNMNNSRLKIFENWRTVDESNYVWTDRPVECKYFRTYLRDEWTYDIYYDEKNEEYVIAQQKRGNELQLFHCGREEEYDDALFDLIRYNEMEAPGYLTGEL